MVYWPGPFDEQFVDQADMGGSIVEVQCSCESLLVYLSQ